MYRLRSKVEFSAADDLAVVAAWDGAQVEGIEAFR